MERWLVPTAVLISLFTLMIVVLAALHVPLIGALSAVFALSIAVPLAFVFAHAETEHHHPR
jgi:hypothetical protein